VAPKITVEEMQALRETRLIFIEKEIERNPTISLNTLGTMCGISRERIRQILKEAGIKKSRARSFLYGYCVKGHKLLEIRSKLNASGKDNRCFTCKPLKPHQWIDPDTGHIKGTKNTVKITCYVCGKIQTFVGEKAVQRVRYNAYRKHPNMQFCSKECLGKTAGSQWGWGNSLNASRKDHPKAKSKTIHGPCDSCGKPTVQSRAKKQYMEDPSVGLSYKNKHMFCSRTCMATFRHKQSIKKLENYIETNTTPLIKRTPNGSWIGGLRITSIPDSKKDKSGGKTVNFVGKTRMEVHKKLIISIRKELRHRTRTIGVDTKKIAKLSYSERAQVLIEENGTLTIKELAQLMNVNNKTLTATLSRNPIFESQPNRTWKLISTKEKEDKTIHEQGPDRVNSGYVEPNSPSALSVLYGYISKRLPFRRR